MSTARAMMIWNWVTVGDSPRSLSKTDAAYAADWMSRWACGGCDVSNTRYRWATRPPRPRHPSYPTLTPSIQRSGEAAGLKRRDVLDLRSRYVQVVVDLDRKST